MKIIEQILAIIVTNINIIPRKQYDDKCFKSPEAFYHHLAMSIETPSTGHLQQFGVKNAIKHALNSVRNRSDFSELFELVAEIKSVCSAAEAEGHFEHILEKLIKYKVVAKCRVGLLFARYVPSNNPLSQHNVYEVVHKHIAGKIDQDGTVWDEIVDELWHNYGTGYEELIGHLNPEYIDAVSFRDIKNNVKALTHQLYKWEQNVLAGDDPFIPEMNKILPASGIEFENNEDYAELVRLGKMSRNTLMTQLGFTQLQLAPYITASVESRLKFLYEHVLFKRERKEIEISLACDKVINYLCYNLTGDTNADISECLKFIEDITAEQFQVKMAAQNYITAPEGTSKAGVIKMGIAKMMQQKEKNTAITLVDNPSIVKGMRPRFNITDAEFSILTTVVTTPTSNLVKSGIFTQGIIDKILTGGSDHQRVHLAHREIDFGIGYAAVARILFTPTPVDIDALVEQSNDYSNTSMDLAGAMTTFHLDLEDKASVSISDLGKKALDLEKDKELVLKSFITFVKEELSEDHKNDVNTGLEILQNYFTADELFIKLTGCDLPAGQQFLGWRNVSGISVKELVSHVITISRRMEAVEREMAGLNIGTIHISLDNENLKPDACEACEAWVVNNNRQLRRQQEPSPTQEALKTKRPDYTVGDDSQVISIKLMDNGNWGKTLQGLIKIFDDRLAELQAIAEKSFTTVLYQIQSGQISYDQVKERLTLPNIHTKNKYDTRYIIKQLGGIPAVKEAIGATLEDMDEKECIAILKFQIALYQQAAGKSTNQDYDQVRDQIGERLDHIWKETVTYHAQTGVPGRSRHYKDGELEMVVVCKLTGDNFGLPMWKTRVDIIRSKHFASNQSLSFSGLQFHSDKEYRKQVLKKLLRA
jgi:hypothetical protein